MKENAGILDKFEKDSLDENIENDFQYEMTVTHLSERKIAENSTFGEHFTKEMH